ncbi:MAG: hypothetical protein JSW02_05170 [candidate division WOR-3 bacterium]|nr:MAG: hypothetical protein JSW02_05170 [candidate division WOR-3 bacterium]
MEISAELKRLARVSNKAAKHIMQYMQVQEAEDNVYVLDKKIDEIERSCEELPECDLKKQLRSWIAQRRDRIKELKEEFRFTFGKKLTSLFSADGIQVKGQYPIVRVAWYTVKIDFEIGEAEVFYGPEVEKILRKIPLHPDMIYDAVKKFDDKLKSSGKELEKLLSAIHSAYERVLRIEGKQPGEKVLIIEVMNQFVMVNQTKKFKADPSKTLFRGTSRVMFSYIVHMLKKTHAAGLHLHVATFDATVDKTRALWIPEDETGEGTHYSYLSFDTDGE